MIFRGAFRRELLRHFPFIVIQEAKDGREAMERIQRMPPSLIFMDIGLPGVNGLQLTQKIMTSTRGGGMKNGNRSKRIKNGHHLKVATHSVNRLS